LRVSRFGCCAPTEHFCWNSTNDPAEKGRHFAGLCLTVFSKRRQEAGKNTVEGAIKLVRFERSISGNQRLKKIRAPIDNGR
jgi:hypothetical protein